jgi:hypothetical protein
MYLYKKYLTKVALILLVGAASLYGADFSSQATSKKLHLIPISYNQATREFSVLLTLSRDLAQPELDSFPADINSFQQLDDATTYMNDFARETIFMYPSELCPSRRSFAFNTERYPIIGAEQEAYMFIEIPFMKGQEITEGAINKVKSRGLNSSRINYIWAPVSSLIAHQENMPYGRYFINKQYLEMLKVILPILKEHTAQILAAPIKNIPQAPKMLYLIPVSYNTQENNTPYIFFNQILSPFYNAFLAAVESFDNLTRYTDYMNAIADTTNGAYPSSLKPLAIGTYAFDTQGNKVDPRSQVGFLYIEIPFIRGKTIWDNLPQQNQYYTNFNWISSNVIMGTTEETLPRGYQRQIDPQLLQALKTTLPLLQKSGNQLILTQYAKGKGAVPAGATQPQQTLCPLCNKAETLRQLPCRHTICEKCWKIYADRNLPCPFCPTPIPH